MLSASELAQKTFKGLQLRPPYSGFLGSPEPKAVMLISGYPGLGKSTLALGIAGELAEHGPVLYVSAEEGLGLTMQEKVKRLGLTQADIEFTGWHGFPDLEKQIESNDIDFVVLDSITAMDRSLKQFDEFRQWMENQGRGLIIVSHSTKAGQYKGDSSLGHDCYIGIEVTDGVARTWKNRYAPTSEMKVNFGDPNRPNPTYSTHPKKRGHANNARDRNTERRPRGPIMAGRVPAAEKSMLAGLEFIKNPGPELRENRPVQVDEIYQLVTDMLINTIKKVGTLPWQKEWKDTAIASGLVATNFDSKKPYRGANFFMLNFQQKVVDGKRIIVPRKFKNPYFLTFKQIKNHKGVLQKGSHGSIVTYWTLLYKFHQADPKLEFGTYDENKMIRWLQSHRGEVKAFEKGYTARQIANQHTIPIIKYYYVFSAEDVTGIDWGTLPENKNADLSPANKIKVAEAINAHYPAPRPPVKHQEQRAYYRPSTDSINMPQFDSFKNPQSYYTTLFHEEIHSTGAKKRLDRDMHGGFGSKPYAKEELIAEMGAAYLCAEAGILFHTIDNSAKYLKSWNRKLVSEMENDNRFFFRAASAAQEASDYILDRNKAGVPAYRKNLKIRSNPIRRITRSTEPLVYLGKAVKVTVASPEGQRVLNNGNGNYLPMFASRTKDRLYIVPAQLVHKTTGNIKDRKADRVYEQWNGYPVDQVEYAIDWPPAGTHAVPIGTADRIWYESDKIIRAGDEKGEQNYYVHTFDPGRRPATVLGNILIISNIKLNERGILN